jgi:hypothetical protein
LVEEGVEGASLAPGSRWEVAAVNQEVADALFELTDVARPGVVVADAIFDTGHDLFETGLV